MIVPSNISDPRDLEIARLRAEVEAERFKRAGAESAYELLSIQSASVVRELERTERALSAARAALDGERSTSDTFREAIRLLIAHFDDDPDEAAHAPPHIRKAIMDYDQRAALRAAGGE